jgi:hypothetical protein
MTLGYNANIEKERARRPTEESIAFWQHVATKGCFPKLEKKALAVIMNLCESHVSNRNHQSLKRPDPVASKESRSCSCLTTACDSVEESGRESPDCFAVH